jgi:predicted HicB family RNase H-like nuclease
MTQPAVGENAMSKDEAGLFARIPVELHRELKVLAARSGTTLSALVEEAIRDLLKKRGE